MIQKNESSPFFFFLSKLNLYLVWMGGRGKKKFFKVSLVGFGCFIGAFVRGRSHLAFHCLSAWFWLAFAYTVISAQLTMSFWQVVELVLAWWQVALALL